MTTENKTTAKQTDALFDKGTAGRPVEKSSTNYRDLLAQREALETKIKEAWEAEVAGVLKQIRQLVDDYGLQSEVQFTHARGQRGRSGPRAPVAAKYRDPVSGTTWSGRGKPPSWIAGKDRTPFAID